MIAQDAYEPAYDDHGELLPTMSYKHNTEMKWDKILNVPYFVTNNSGNPYTQIDVMRENLQREYAEKCFKRNFVFPYLIGMIVGCVIMIVLGKL
jgi:hypothetical protein